MGKTILIVDDSDDTRFCLAAVLKREGYNVLIAKDGIDALDMLKTNDIKADMIITDLNMPEMNGIELVKYLRGTLLYFSVPIVLITGKCSDSSKCEAVDAGINEWIEKPFTAMQLKEAVNKFLR